MYPIMANTFFFYLVAVKWPVQRFQKLSPGFRFPFQCRDRASICFYHSGYPVTLQMFLQSQLPFMDPPGNCFFWLLNLQRLQPQFAEVFVGWGGLRNLQLFLRRMRKIPVWKTLFPAQTLRLSEDSSPAILLQPEESKQTNKQTNKYTQPAPL